MYFPKTLTMSFELLFRSAFCGNWVSWKGKELMFPIAINFNNRVEIRLSENLTSRVSPGPAGNSNSLSVYRASSGDEREFEA